MKNIQQIQIVLSRMAELLRAGGLNGWALAMENFKTEIAISPDTTVATIISLFGRMGSLYDLVLYSSGQPCVAENHQFDELRRQLFSLCRE